MVFALIITNGDLMSLFNEKVVIRISNSKKDGSGLEGMLRGLAKGVFYVTIAGAIGFFANKWAGDPTGLEKRLGAGSDPKLFTMVFDSKEYLVFKNKNDGYYYSVNDLIQVNEAKRKLNPADRLSVGTVYLLRYDKLVVPILIKRGVSDTIYTEPEKVLVGELKEGDKYIIGIE